MYEVLFRVKVRVPNPNNKSGHGWHKLPSVLISGKTIEDIMEEIAKFPPPDDIETEAISAEGTLSLTKEKSPTYRKNVELRMFRQL